MPRLMENTAVVYLILAHIIIGSGIAVVVAIEIIARQVTKHKRRNFRNARR